MISASGRYVLMLNGEIYNYRDLRAELEHRGCAFRGTSDTEVLLAAIEHWGVREAIRRAAGMFAIVLWDRTEHRLFLIRDRLGIKPLFIARIPGGIAFASELKAFRSLPLFDPTPDAAAASLFLRYCYVPEPHTIYRHVTRLPAGRLLAIRDPLALPEPEPFWSLAEVARAGLEQPFAGTEQEAEEHLAGLLHHVVQQHMLADVPLGAFLSGGIDSSTVTAMAQAGRSDRVRTYCIAFDDPVHNEAHHAAQVAAHLGTDHHEISVTGREALELVPEMATIFDEPFADSSQIPTALLCRLARREVTVALSGEGGDEIFGGYNRYTYAIGLFAAMDRLPRSLRSTLGRLLGLPSSTRWDRLLSLGGPLLPTRYRIRLAGEKVAKLAALLDQNGDEARYRSLISAWHDPSEVLLDPEPETGDPLSHAFALSLASDRLARLLLVDQLTYLPGDQLTRADRVSMAAGLELRVPLLDHRVVEFSWQLPTAFKIRPGRGKHILRRVLHRYVPPALVERPKIGFTVPLAAWLRGPLRDWAEALLAPEAVARSGLLRAAAVRRAWAQCRDSRPELAHRVWALLMLRAWEECSSRPQVGG
jgi:asparagine synthase (glutamine-hydrolysing)